MYTAPQVFNFPSSFRRLTLSDTHSVSKIAGSTSGTHRWACRTFCWVSLWENPTGFMKTQLGIATLFLATELPHVQNLKNWLVWLNENKQPLNALCEGVMVVIKRLGYQVLFRLVGIIMFGFLLVAQLDDLFSLVCIGVHVLGLLLVWLSIYFSS